MNIQIGDIVRFLSEKLEGKVTGIIDTSTVNVYCEVYGFEIPASVNDLVVIHPTPSSSAPSAISVPATVRDIPTEVSNGLYLALVPDNFQNLPESRYELYLVNDTQQTCLYSFSHFDGEKYTGISAGNCAPDTAVEIGTYRLKDFESIKSVHIQAIFYQKGNFIPHAPIEGSVKIIPTSCCKSGTYKHYRWFGPMALLRAINKEVLAEETNALVQKEVRKEKVKGNESKRPTRQIVNNIVEIDLHIDQLLDTTTGMSNKDILEYQLDIFRKVLEEYKLRSGQKIVFIHGKGDGILRQRILWELQTRYKRFRHQDASFKQYGYGATMVIIK